LIHLDLRDSSEVRSVLLQFRPDIILCAAAQPNVELCEIDPQGTQLINVAGMQNLLAVTNQLGAALVYFSSEYVFDGIKGPYSEPDECNPLNEYGRQKLMCEQMVSAQIERHIIGRISGVYNWEASGKNFVARCIDVLNSGRKFEVPSDQIITPTYAPSLAECVRRLVEKDNWGLFHLSGSESMPRAEFAYLVAQVFGLDSALITPTPTSNLRLRARRPSSAGLKVEKAREFLGGSLLSPREGLERMRQNRERNSGLAV
jgi:dTDP-4-dehydrorhamnose reductase